MSKKRQRTENHFERVLETSREEEALKIRELHDRLAELTRIAKTRNFANASAEIHRLQNEHAAEIREIERSNKEKISEFIMERNELMQALEATQQDLENVRRELGIFRDIHRPKAMKTQQELRNHIKALEEESVAADQKLIELNETKESLLEKKADLETANEAQAASVQKNKNEIQKHVSWTAVSRDRADVQLKDFYLLIDKARSEQEHLQKELDKFSGTYEEMEASVRERFSSEVKEELESKKEKYDRDRVLMMRELETKFTQKEEACRAKLQRRLQTNKQFEARLAGLLVSNEEKKRIAANQEERVRQLTQILADLEAQKEAEVAAYESESLRIKKSLKRFRSERNEKDRAYDDLMDCEVALRQETQRYKELLDYEENRLQYTSPDQPRRTESKTD